MNPIYAKSSAYINFDIEDNGEDPKFKVGNHGRISKYFHWLIRNIFIYKLDVDNLVPVLVDLKN